MKASELVVGNEFKFPGKRKTITVTKIVNLDQHDVIPPVGRKILILDGCRQFPMLLEKEIILVNKGNENI